MSSLEAEIQAIFDRRCKVCGAGLVGRTFTRRADDCKKCDHLSLAHVSGQCAAPLTTGHPELGLCRCRERP